MVYLLISILRAAGVFVIFVFCWLVAYTIGQGVVKLGLMDCGDPAACELGVGIVIMPLGGTVLYILSLAAWALSVRKQNKAL